MLEAVTALDSAVDRTIEGHAAVEMHSFATIDILRYKVFWLKNF